MVYVPSLPTRYDAATDSRVPTVDLNPALKYGELKVVAESPLTDPEIGNAVGIASTTRIRDGDYVLAVGDIIVTAALIARAVQLNGKASVLRWDKSASTYRITEVSW